jgi:hypothetical protein
VKDIAAVHESGFALFCRSRTVRAIVAFGGKADIGHGHRNPLRSFTTVTCGVAAGSLTPVGSAPAQTPR